MLNEYSHLFPDWGLVCAHGGRLSLDLCVRWLARLLNYLGSFCNRVGAGQ